MGDERQVANLTLIPNLRGSPLTTLAYGPWLIFLIHGGGPVQDKEPDSGFLSLNRAIALDRLVDRIYHSHI